MKTTVSLNGLWDFVVDLDPKYHGEPNYARPDWNRGQWLKVAVPGVWNKYAARYDIFEGVAWFAREFDVPALTDGTIGLLRFGGVNYLCEVYINGQHAGAHEGGYSEFVIDVSALIREGRNLIAVRVDNRSSMTRLPPVLGYFNYGGIHRDVGLELYQDAYLTDLACEAEPNGQESGLFVSGRVAGRDLLRPRHVEVTCAGMVCEVEVEAGGKFRLELRLGGVEPWSPDHPALYPTRVALLHEGRVSDARDFDVGLRTIRVNGTAVELNNRPLDLRGICYLYDSPIYGLSLRPEQYDVDLALLRELGVNAIRSHFPLDHAFYSACDRAGMLVWIEPPVYCIDPKLECCRSAFTDPSWRRLALSMLEEMIQHARLHPSVAIYGIGNECQLEAPGALEFFRALATRAKELDRTRPISYACLYGLVGAIAEMVDIVGFNEYWGWYDIIFRPDATEDRLRTPDARAVDLTELDALLRRQAASCHKPVLLTEFGADSIPGYRSAARELWSEDYHAEVLRATLDIVDRYAFVRGTFPFVFADYRDPSKEINGYWDEFNYKGVVTYERRRKRPFFALQEAYARRAAGREPRLPT